MKYCELGTYAMVKVWEELVRAGEEGSMEKNLIDTFIKTITKDPCKKYFKKDTKFDEYMEDGKLKSSVFEEALYQGYLDACRTITGASKIDEDTKKSVLKGTAKEIEKYLQNGENFNHGGWCENLIEAYSDSGIKITYGHAQKIINMAFKYLYCIYYKAEKLEYVENKFKECHMPLDSFSLEWFKRNFKKEGIKSGRVGSWSAMKEKEDDKYYTYEFYSKKIGNYCSANDDITPLKLDFIVWPKMQKIMVAEEFIKAFGVKPKEEASYELKDLNGTLKNRLKEVKDISEKQI